MKASRIVGLAVTLWLCACATPAHPPAPPLPLPAAYPQADPQWPQGAAAQRWWLALHDPVLDRLIDQAQSANLDVRIALARVAEARGASTATGSRLLPAVNLGGDAYDSRSGLPAQVKFGLPDTRALQLNLNLAWELDLMGAASAASAGARADLQAAGWAVRGAQLMVADEVARQYLLLQSLERGQALLGAVLTTYDRTARLVEVRIHEGTAAQIDLERLQAERAGVRARMPQFAADRSALRDRLALLLGQPVGSALGLKETPPVPPSDSSDPFDPGQLLTPGNGLLADPGQPPVGAPADLLLRRPDLQTAAAQVTAELARLRQAHAERYPHFFLSALFGGEKLTLNSIPYSPARYSNAALAFSAPLFDAGRLEAMERIQDARASAAELGWQQAVLRAVQEVDVSLAAVKAQRQRSEELLRARTRALAALDRLRALQREGEADQLAVLELVRLTLQIQAALLDAERDRGLAAIQLYAALGGGWPPSEAEDRP